MVQGVLVSEKNLLLRLEPVVELGDRMIAALDVKFVSALTDSFFAWKCLDQGVRSLRGRWHGKHLR